MYEIMKIYVYIACMISIAACATKSYSDDRPEALRRLEFKRHALHTAHIEWSDTDPNLYGPHPRFITTRITGEDIIDHYRGDEDGIFDRHADGTPLPIQMKPFMVLSKNGEVWLHHEKQWNADHFPNGTATVNMRALGLTGSLPYCRVEEALWHEHVKQPSPRKYSETLEGEYQVIRAETDYGTLEWWLDPKCDGEIVRYVHRMQGDVIQEAKIALRQYGDIWYPESVSYYSKGHQEGNEPRQTIRIHYADFNQPEHSRSYEPKDIGIEAGIHIMQYDPHRKRMAYGLCYDGNYIVTDDEILERWAAGDVTLGPTVQRMAAENAARRQYKEGSVIQDKELMLAADVRYANGAKDYLTVWQEYTRQFIERYKLNDQQSQKAWMICLECEAEARGHLAKLKSKLDEIQERLEKASKSKEKAEQDHAAELRERRHKLFEPIERIFERQLKPRLEKIPTRAQRETADQNAVNPNVREKAAAEQKKDRE